MDASLVLLALSTLLAEDAACIAAGALVASGRLGFVEASLACFAGILLGDLGLFAAGRAARRPLEWLVSAEKLHRASEWLSARGASAILLSRFTPGMRLPVYVAAGALRTNPRMFFVTLCAACAVWTPTLVGLSAGLGERAAVTLSAAAIAAFALLRLMPRLTRWEFWPAWAVYVPVLPWILALAVRYRSLTLFTAANPGIETGGFAGESKSRILEKLRPSGAVAPQGNGTFPMVVKPDVGERGTGVSIVRTRAELCQALAAIDGPAIVQQYVPGLEFGVFYSQGRVTSITEKRFPAVVGDGRSTLKQLILADERARLLAAVYLRNRDASRVPAAGERVPLVEIGSHCRGAVFLDATHLRTPALEARLRVISDTHGGFCFGRYDVRTPSVEAFQRGELTVLELNGVSAEPAHIYDPSVSLWSAYAALFRHWSEAYRIGAENRAQGAYPTPLPELVRVVARHLFRRRKRAPIDTAATADRVCGA
jgi:membrane protein DedA with SNARE-associated domain